MILLQIVLRDKERVFFFFSSSESFMKRLCVFSTCRLPTSCRIVRMLCEIKIGLQDLGRRKGWAINICVFSLC